MFKGSQAGITGELASVLKALEAISDNKQVGADDGSDELLISSRIDFFTCLILLSS